MSAEELRRRAAQKLTSLRRRRRDPRYLQALGRFVAEGLLTSNEPVEPWREPLEVESVLWAGQIEPRFLELVPALLVKQPSLFADPGNLPADLARVVARLRRNLEPEAFRGIQGRRLLEWLPRVGRTAKLPSRLKSFRFRPLDLRILKSLSAELGISETEVIRRGLRALRNDQSVSPAPFKPHGCADTMA